MSFEFGNTLYRNRSDLLAGVAYQYWTGGGSNSPETVDGFGCSADGLREADDAIEGWGLDLRTDFDDVPAWMETNEVTREELAEAMREFWRTRPDRVAEEDEA